MKLARRYIAIALLCLSLSSSTLAAKGIVAKRLQGCDYFLVYVGSTYDYTLMEWYGGYDPDKGDILYGTMGEYGFHNIYYGDRQTKVWIEDYGLDTDDALDKLYEHCDE